MVGHEPMNLQIVYNCIIIKRSRYFKKSGGFLSTYAQFCVLCNAVGLVTFNDISNTLANVKDNKCEKKKKTYPRNTRIQKRQICCYVCINLTRTEISMNELHIKYITGYSDHIIQVNNLHITPNMGLTNHRIQMNKLHLTPNMGLTNHRIQMNKLHITLNMGLTNHRI